MPERQKTQTGGDEPTRHRLQSQDSFVVGVGLTDVRLALVGLVLCRFFNSCSDAPLARVYPIATYRTSASRLVVKAATIQR